MDNSSKKIANKVLLLHSKKKKEEKKKPFTSFVITEQNINSKKNYRIHIRTYYTYTGEKKRERAWKRTAVINKNRAPNSVHRRPKLRKTDTRNFEEEKEEKGPKTEAPN